MGAVGAVGAVGCNWEGRVGMGVQQKSWKECLIWSCGRCEKKAHMRGGKVNIAEDIERNGFMDCN